MGQFVNFNPHSEPALGAGHAVRLGLALEIARLVAERRLTQTEAAELVGATQPNISAILAGKVDGLSIERLVRILNALDHDVHLVVLPKSVRARRASARVFACRSEPIADTGVS